MMICKLTVICNAYKLRYSQCIIGKGCLRSPPTYDYTGE